MKLQKVIYILLLAFLFTAPLTASQLRADQNQQDTKDSIYSVVEKMPEFPGGEKALISFLNQNIKFPAEAQKKKEQGKVIVQFVIGKTGKVENANVLKTISPSLDAEALRVISLLPDWTPGEQNGEKVAVYRIIPILFQKQSEEEAWQVNEKTVVVIDGIKMPEKFNTNILNPSKLSSVNVLKPFPTEEKKKLMDQYGRQAENGVILITTNKDEIYYALADSVKSNAECKEPAGIPEFQGGKEKMFSYIADSIQYPFVPKEMKTQGKVIVRFLVDMSGKVSDAKVMKSLDYYLDKEALRVISSMPDWIPGKKCNQKLDIYVTMPVTFTLDLPANEKGWEKNDKTIILLNGVKLPGTFDLKLLNYANLSSYKVLQPTTKEVTKKLVSQYGRDAVNGVILIDTQK